jgi:thymidine phosphorylase
MDKSAGIHLAVATGDTVNPGAHFFTIHPIGAAELEAAALLAAENTGFRLDQRRVDCGSASMAT